MTVLTNELLNIFHQKVPVSNENIKLTNRVILQPASTLTRMAVPPQENVPLNKCKSESEIIKCHEDAVITGEIEACLF